MSIQLGGFRETSSSEKENDSVKENSPPRKRSRAYDEKLSDRISIDSPKPLKIPKIPAIVIPPSPPMPIISQDTSTPTRILSETDDPTVIVPEIDTDDLEASPSKRILPKTDDSTVVMPKIDSDDQEPSPPRQQTSSKSSNAYGHEVDSYLKQNGLVLGTPLGEGAFGKVHRLRDVRGQKTGKAIKCIPPKKLFQAPKYFNPDSCDALSVGIDDPNVLGAKAVIRGRFSLLNRELTRAIVMDEVENAQTLDHWMAGNPSAQRTFSVAKKIAQAVASIHEKGICHRDIKPENILIDEEDRVKVCDFGIARKFEQLTRSTSFVGTPAYLAPEATGDHALRNLDAWSLGAVFHEMAYKTRPLNNGSPILLPETPRIPPLVKATIQGLLAVDPDRRMSAAQAYENLNRL